MCICVQQLISSGGGRRNLLLIEYLLCSRHCPGYVTLILLFSEYFSLITFEGLIHPNTAIFCHEKHSDSVHLVALKAIHISSFGNAFRF